MSGNEKPNYSYGSGRGEEGTEQEQCVGESEGIAVALCAGGRADGTVRLGCRGPLSAARAPKYASLGARDAICLLGPVSKLNYLSLFFPIDFGYTLNYYSLALLTHVLRGC